MQNYCNKTKRIVTKMLLFYNRQIKLMTCTKNKINDCI